MSAVNPDYYRDHPAFSFEAIEVAKYMDFITGNVFKYLMRAGRKGDRLEDLCKAHWYLDNLPAPNISIIPQNLVHQIEDQATDYLQDRESDVEWLTVAAILHLVRDNPHTAKDMVQTAIQKESH